MKSSVAATLPLSHTSSHHQRVRALFFSSSNTEASLPSLPTRLSLAGAMHHTHDASRRPAAHRLEAYSPNLVEGKFCELRLVEGVLGTSRLLRSFTFATVAFVVESQLAPMRQQQRHLPHRAYRRRQQTSLVSSPHPAEA